MASDRLYELDGKKGHWYTDDQGNRYFVAQGQTPKEGWEATKRRKMIKGGKYVKDDGDDKGEQEISANEYQTYEADEEERFDETTDADFEDDKPEDFDRDPLIDSEENEDGRKIALKVGDMDLTYDNLDEAISDIANWYIRTSDKNLAEKLHKALFDLRDKRNGQNEENDTDLYSQPAYGDEEGHDYELNALREREERGLDNDQGFDRDDDDERSWGPGAKHIERRAKDIEQLRKMGWDDDRIINAFVDQGYDEMEVEDFLNSKKASDDDGTNGWKPSEEATPAYDVGGFYSINKGDRWEYDGGGFVEVHNVAGENVEITTPSGTEWVTKDELSDMVKNATKISASANQGKSKVGDREIPWTAGEIEDEDNAEYLKGKSGPQTANIDANVDTIAKEVASKFGEANVKVNENGHILLKDPEGFDPVAIANEDEIPTGAIVKIMPNWREPNENPDDTYFVKEDRGDRLLLWSPSKSSSFGGYTYEWPKNTMYVPPRMRGRNPNPTEGKQNPVGKQGSEGDSRNEEGSENTIDDAFDYLKKLYDDPETRVSAIRKTVEKFPNASNYEIGRVMEKLIEYSKGKK